MTREEMRRLAEANVATWPPLTREANPERWDRLYVLLAPLRAALADIHRAQQGSDAA